MEGAPRERLTSKVSSREPLGPAARARGGLLMLSGSACLVASLPAQMQQSNDLTASNPLAQENVAFTHESPVPTYLEQEAAPR